MVRALKLAHLVLSLDVGGLERVVLELVREGQLLNHEVTVVCVTKPGAMAQCAVDLGAQVVSVDKPPGLQFDTVARLARVFRQHNIELIHTHQIAALLYAGFAARRAGVKAVVHTEHGNHLVGRVGLRSRFKAKLLWGLAASQCDHFFCVSDDIARAVSALGVIPKRKVSVARNGIETARFLPSNESVAESKAALGSLGMDPGSLVIGTIGRLAEVKRQDLLIRGFARVARDRPQLRLLLVGDGPEREALASLVASLGLADRVCFAGYCAQPEVLLRGMDIFALTSRSEGAPLAVLEAWAAGRPVVASRVGGIPSLIEHGRTGLMFESGDESGLADQLLRLINHPDEAVAIGQAGQRRALAEFDSRVMAEQYDAHYRAWLPASSVAHSCAELGG